MEDIIAFFSDKVAQWQIPDMVDELPRNTTGKVLKNKLREAHGNVLLPV